MSNRSVGSLALVTLLAVGVRTVRAEDPAPKDRTFTFTYSAKIPKPVAGAKHLDVWVPLPLEDQMQSVADLKVEATAGSASPPVQQTKDEPYGNRYAYVSVDDPTSEVTVTWTAKITRKPDIGQGTGPVLDRFREADHLVPITGLAAEIAKTLGVDQAAMSPEERAKKIYENVLTTMTYDKNTPGYGKGDFQRACEVGKGNCTDFHAKFTGVGRAAGLPVRFTMGIPLSTEPEGTAGGYHCWAHWHDGKSWRPVDISEAQKVNAQDPAKAQWFFGHLDPDRVALTVGRDLVLSPKQKGAPLLFIAYPYVEVDGAVVEVPKENRTFTWAP